ncbi:MAG TPA: hypothetical protein PKE07_15340 [Lacibacter sp.]|nr:hypothetical protein [Lacibacter sp.]HMO90536.1 hypothetical protein [Lacibacter sp.]
MNSLTRFYLLTLLLTAAMVVRPVYAQTIRINEVSNGPNGSKEWVELLVIPTNPVPASLKYCFYEILNIGNWVLDDNSGVFSPTNHFTGSGIASGHMRFKNTLPWTRLPMGALIVIYNVDDKDPLIPADDPLDFNNDCVYIVPSNHSSLEYCSNAAPVAGGCTTITGYSSCSGYADYSAASALRRWDAIGLANAGDGIQLRNSSGVQVHGVVYGSATSATGCATTPPLVGNAVSPLVDNLPGGNSAFRYNGTNLAGYVSAANWERIAAADATPGAANSASNNDFIENDIRMGCICDIALPLGNSPAVSGARQPQALRVRATAGRVVLTAEQPVQLTLHVYLPDGRLAGRSSWTVSGSRVVDVPGTGMRYVVVEGTDSRRRYFREVVAVTR